MSTTRFEPGSVFSWEQNGQQGYGLVIDPKNQTSILFIAIQNTGVLSRMGTYGFVLDERLVPIPETAILTNSDYPLELAAQIKLARLLLIVLRS